ncbi:hypothetical protein [Paenibacillus nuruki]|nr:hypothetical protein [Paenibacillus nuruki]
MISHASGGNHYSERAERSPLERNPHRKAVHQGIPFYQRRQE